MPVANVGIEKLNQTKFQEEIMKKFWIVLLALGLIAGFAMSASAADVKFSGSYYVNGVYIDNPQYRKADDRTYGAQAYYHQRLRVQTEFKVAEGLSLVTRFDALEKPWGYGTLGVTADAWRGSNSYDVTNRAASGAGTARVQENIEFERAYVDFTTKIGRFMVGYQNFVAWGTMFADTHITRPGIKYFVPVGPLTIVAAIEKTIDNNAGAGTTTNADNNIYDLGAIVKFGAGEAGLMFQYADANVTRWTRGEGTKLYVFNPYAKMKFGPVYIEAEGAYGFGKYTGTGGVYDTYLDADAVAYAFYLNAKADIGPAYVGGIFAYMSGDDVSDLTKKQGNFAGVLLVNDAWDPCLIMWNTGAYGANHRQATPMGYAAAALGTLFDNAYLVQIYGGIKPIKPLDIMASVTYATADRTPLVGQAYEYGWEIDLTAKYKIFDNLEYMIGGAYHIAGDFFKGANKANSIDNNYMLIHRLSLSF
jgi:hypothetical protein